MRPLLITVVRLTIGVSCAACTLGVASFFAMRSAAQAYPVGQSFPAPSGYGLDGRYVASTPASCYMIRITSDGCPYCGRDRGQYVRLAREAARAGCRVVALAPRIGMMALRGDEPALQLQYVDMKLGRALNPFFTPQTVVLDGEGRVGWQRQGAMGDRDLALALETLAAFPHRSRVSPDHDGATRAGRLQQ